MIAEIPDRVAPSSTLRPDRTSCAAVGTPYCLHLPSQHLVSAVPLAEIRTTQARRGSFPPRIGAAHLAHTPFRADRICVFPVFFSFASHSAVDSTFAHICDLGSAGHIFSGCPQITNKKIFR